MYPFLRKLLEEDLIPNEGVSHARGREIQNKIHNKRAVEGIPGKWGREIPKLEV